MKQTSTKERALKEGRALLQQHGYNGFSFQDIADRLGIKKPSLYDHYASKEELVTAILTRYSEQLDHWTASIATEKPIEQVRKVFDVFHAFSSDHEKICPVLALTADLQILTKDVKLAMRDFVDKWLTWLESQIVHGQKTGEIRKDMDAKTLSSFIYSQGIGSQYLARFKKEPKLTLTSGNMIVQLIKSKASKH